jgi:hypothetical protein
MARRGGKAASRKSRQRRTQQRSQQRSAQPIQPATTPPVEDVEAPTLEPSVPVESGDAFEKADAELRASTPRPGSRPSSGPREAARSVRARVSDFHMSSGPSRLSETAGAEYHYVMRDLRNIGVLLVVVAVLLAAAVVLVNVLDIGRV